MVVCNATPARHLWYVNYITPFPRNVNLGRLWEHESKSRDPIVQNLPGAFPRTPLPAGAFGVRDWPLNKSNLATALH